MTKSEFIVSNQYLRKGFSNLTDDDKQLFSDVATGKVDPKAKDTILRFKQVMYHMSSGMNLWEMRGLLKAFKTLQGLPN